MMRFDPLAYHFPSRRNVVFARRGACCSTSPIVSQIGLSVLQRGGNAVDAALAMAMAFPVAEPTSNSLGSDCFALVWNEKEKKLYGLNGSGTAPRALSAEKVRALGHTDIPNAGWIPAMVPGAPGAWAALSERFGTVPLPQLAAPACRYAREGVPVAPTVARMWAAAAPRILAAAEKDPATHAAWIETFLPEGRPLGPGELFRAPDMADTLEELAATKCRSLYDGALLEKVLVFSEATGGYFQAEDFRAYEPLWVTPLSVRYHGYDVFELPPNGHGITVLMALQILSALEETCGPVTPEARFAPDTMHRVIEAMKLAFTDTKTYVADPAFMKTRTEDLLSPAYAARRARLIGAEALDPRPGKPAGDTVYFCTADSEGNMVSFIQSHYMNFGAGIVVPGTGISLQNRGANFSLDPASDNCLAGGKRAYHTIIPGFLMQDGRPVGPFGVMGGFMQPQGHLQVLLNTIDCAMNPQDALDAPRFQWQGGRTVELERGIPQETGDSLAARGHEVVWIDDPIDMGRGQIIWRTKNGLLACGTEPRADGQVAVW